MYGVWSYSVFAKVLPVKKITELMND